MNPSILKGVAAGVGLGLLNFALSIFTVRLASKSKTFQKTMAVTFSSMLIRIGILLVGLYLISRIASLNFMSVVISFIATYIVFMVIEVYYVARMGRSKIKGKESV